MNLIGLTGPAGSGKSTVARILSDHYGFAELSFAAPIRDFVCRLTGWTLDTLQALKEEPHVAFCGRLEAERNRSIQK